MPEVAEGEDGIALEGLSEGELKRLHAGGDGLALDVEVGENDIGELGFERGEGDYVFEGMGGAEEAAMAVL